MSPSELTLARWVTKKAARRAMAFGVSASGLLSVAELAARLFSPRVRVLTYHRFGESRRDPFCLPAAVFEAQMRWLGEHGLALSSDQLEAFLAGRQPVPEGAALVTIDDGCLSTLSIAAPVLRRYRVPAVVFICPALVGASCPNVLPERFLDWDELSEVASYGFDIGSHGYTHRSLGRMVVDDARRESIRARDAIQDRLGVGVRCFAYPFGTQGDHSARTDRILADAGYRLAFHSVHGAIRVGMDPIGLPRIKIESGEPAWLFPRICRGAMDAWQFVDRNLWRFQRLRTEVIQP